MSSPITWERVRSAKRPRVRALSRVSGTDSNGKLGHYLANWPLSKQTGGMYDRDSMWRVERPPSPRPSPPGEGEAFAAPWQGEYTRSLGPHRAPPISDLCNQDDQHSPLRCYGHPLLGERAGVRAVVFNYLSYEPVRSMATPCPRFRADSHPLLQGQKPCRSRPLPA